MDHVLSIAQRIQDVLSRQERAFVAIDGMAASGKTTLAAALERRFASCAVIHMDDFTIPLDQRRPGYFDAQVSNADIARFDREAFSPLLRGQDACYRPYACHPVPGFLDPIRIAGDTRVVIVEGAYCLHPQLFARYDLRALSLIEESVQRKRILARNGQAQLARFESLWIPMENRHIASRSLRALCDVVLLTDQAI